MSYKTFCRQFLYDLQSFHSYSYNLGTRVKHRYHILNRHQKYLLSHRQFWCRINRKQTMFSGALAHQEQIILNMLTRRIKLWFNNMNKPLSSQDKFSYLSSEIANVITHLHFIKESHLEITNKIKNIRAIGIFARVNKLKKWMRPFLWLMIKHMKCLISLGVNATSTTPNNQTLPTQRTTFAIMIFCRNHSKFLCLIVAANASRWWSTYFLQKSIN